MWTTKASLIYDYLDKHDVPPTIYPLVKRELDVEIEGYTSQRVRVYHQQPVEESKPVKIAVDHGKTVAEVSKAFLEYLEKEMAFSETVQPIKRSFHPIESGCKRPKIEKPKPEPEPSVTTSTATTPATPATTVTVTVATTSTATKTKSPMITLISFVDKISKYGIVLPPWRTEFPEAIAETLAEYEYTVLLFSRYPTRISTQYKKWWDAVRDIQRKPKQEEKVSDDGAKIHDEARREEWNEVVLEVESKVDDVMGEKFHRSPWQGGEWKLKLEVWEEPFIPIDRLVLEQWEFTRTCFQYYRIRYQASHSGKDRDVHIPKLAKNIDEIIQRLEDGGERYFHNEYVDDLRILFKEHEEYLNITMIENITTKILQLIGEWNNDILNEKKKEFVRSDTKYRDNVWRPSIDFISSKWREFNNVINTPEKYFKQRFPGMKFDKSKVPKKMIQLTEDIDKMIIGFDLARKGSPEYRLKKEKELLDDFRIHLYNGFGTKVDVIWEEDIDKHQSLIKTLKGRVYELYETSLASQPVAM